MITDRDPRWRAVRLENEESVIYLQRLLRAGWYLMELDVDGLSTLSFFVPIKPPPHISGRVLVYGKSPETFSVIVLRKGRKKGRQVAVAIYRDPDGRLDLTQGERPGEGWRLLTNLWMENRGAVFIYEKEDA